MESIKKLIEAYLHISHNVARENSKTANLIISGDSEKAAVRLKQEMGELVTALHGDHAHSNQKTRLAAELLRRRNLDTGKKDILLELHQVAYWCLVYKLSCGEQEQLNGIIPAILRGKDTGISVERLVEYARKSISVSDVFTLIGRIAAETGLPPDLFAELDLMDMRTKDYLADFFS